MKIRKFLQASGLLTAAALFASVLAFPAGAAVQPYVEGGNIYRVKNLTKGGDFTDPVSADKCEELQYRVRIHNPGPDIELESVNVKAVIPSAASTQNVSTITITSTNANPGSTSDTATVNLSQSLKITYVAGSSQLLDANGSVLQSIGDVTSGSGVNIGKVGISVEERRFVQFKAKVDCPKPPVTPPEQPPEQPEQPPEQPEQPKPAVVTTPEQPAPPSSPAPEVLPAAGPADVGVMVALISGASILGSYYYRYVLRRLS